MKKGDLVVLIVEDGDEYLENLSRFVVGPTYIQAHNGAEALDILSKEQVDVVYLDMRFDRTPHSELIGDHAAATRECNGDPVRAWRHLQNNQGLFVLHAVKEARRDGIPIILAYDFSLELRRYEHLKKVYPTLRWVEDAVTPEEIDRIFCSFLETASS